MSATTLGTISSKASIFGALDEAPMTPARYLYWLLASGGTFLDGYSVVSLGIAVPLLERDLAITPTIEGLIGSALVLGAVLGATLGGVAADKIGRKRAFIVDMGSGESRFSDAEARSEPRSNDHVGRRCSP